MIEYEFDVVSRYRMKAHNQRLQLWKTPSYRRSEIARMGGLASYAKDPERYREIGRKSMSKVTDEQRAEWVRKRMTETTPEQRSALSRHSNGCRWWKPYREAIQRIKDGARQTG
jgi:hypothetical protein